MEFTCATCGKTYVRLSAWKRHMSKDHGGWDESDVARVTAGGDGTSEENVTARMQAFAESLKGGSPEAEGANVPEQPASAEPAPPAPLPIKTIKATPKKLKAILGSIPKSLLEQAKIELDEEDKAALDEAGEFLVELFGVEFQVDQNKTVVKSRIWAFAWVGGVMLIIYVKHQFSGLWAQLYEMYKQKQVEGKDV